MGWGVLMWVKSSPCFYDKDPKWLFSVCKNFQMEYFSRVKNHHNYIFEVKFNNFHVYKEGGGGECPKKMPMGEKVEEGT